MDKSIEETCLDQVYAVESWPLSAHDTLITELILKRLMILRDLEWARMGKDGNSPFHSGIQMAISYFRVMGDAKSEQEHQDAFCTPIIEVL